MTKRYVVLYWLLLLIPTFVIATFLFQIMRREQNRIAQEAYDSARDRANTLADTIRLTTRGVQHTLTQALLLLPVEDIVEQLKAMAKTTDLVSDVFVWSPKEGLRYPVPGDANGLGQGQFIRRYEPLFSGRIPWASAGTTACRGPGTLSVRPQVASPTRAVAAQSIPPAPQGEIGGWIPWFSENRQSVLGWVQRTPENIVYGAELDLTTLLYWFVRYFPDVTPKGIGYALLDGSGRILYQTGSQILDSQMKPALTVSLAPYLPHWHVAMYMDTPLISAGGQGFLVLSVLLLAIFIAAIVLGGSLLTLQAHRNIKHAQQKTSFISNVSHELKTPLTSIRMYAELLKEDRIKDPDKKSHYLNVIVGESQRLTRLVNNVLDFSRLEQGRKQYYLKRMELTAFLRYIVETERLRIQKAGMTLRNEIPEADYWVETDKDAIEQVVLNLLDNAIKYASEGKEITVDLNREDGQLKLRVMDRGPGVPPKHRARIFEKFHRVDNSLTTRQPGSGLGLSIARSIMRDLKGDLLYEPREGGGSCFSVLFQLAPQEALEEPLRGVGSP